MQEETSYALLEETAFISTLCGNNKILRIKKMFPAWTFFFLDNMFFIYLLVEGVIALLVTKETFQKFHMLNELLKQGTNRCSIKWGNNV